MRLYHCGAAFCKKRKGKVSKMSEAVSARLFRISTAPRLRLPPPQPAEDVYYEKEPDRIKAILERKKAEKDASAVSNRKALRSSLK